MKIRLSSNRLQSDSIVDGNGVRTVIWTQGCSHNCKGCHNPQTHSFQEGFLVDTNDIIKEIETLEGQDGITFSGGDPMFQAEACLEIAKYCKKQGLNIWCYTGFTYEELLKKAEFIPAILEFLKTIDVLVDGKFILEEKSYNVKFRGSKNQRLIDVQKSLKNNKVHLLEEEVNTLEFITARKQYLFV